MSIDAVLERKTREAYMPLKLQQLENGYNNLISHYMVQQAYIISHNVIPHDHFYDPYVVCVVKNSITAKKINWVFKQNF